MKKYLTVAMFFVLAVALVSPVSVSAKTKAGTKSGSFFYFFDKAFEKTNLFFTFSAEKKAKKALEYAEERLAEAEESANENKPEAVAEAMENYQENISLAEMEAKAIKDEAKTKTLLSTIASSTSKHQEILMEVLNKVPAEAKEAIQKAIEASKKGREEATKETEELEKEVPEIKQEVEETENEMKEDENEEMEIKDDKKDKQSKEIEKLKQNKEPQPRKINQSSEIERLRKEIEDLKKKVEKQQTPSVPENNQSQSSNITPSNITSVIENPVLKIEKCKIEAQAEIDKSRETVIAVTNLGYEKCVQNTSEYIQQQCPECRTPEMFQSIQSTCHNKAQDSLTTLKSEMYNQKYLECLNR